MQLLSFSFILFQASLDLPTTQQSPAPPLQANSALPVATPLAPPKPGDEYSQESPLGDRANAAFQTPRASSTGDKPNISPGAGSDNTEMLPASCAMSVVTAGSLAGMSVEGGSAAMSEDGDGAAQFPVTQDFPWSQRSPPIPLQLGRLPLTDMLAGEESASLLRPKNERHSSSDLIEAPGRSDTADPTPSPSPSASPVATPVSARIPHEGQESGVSVFYAATIGSKCIHVGNALHLEKFSFKYWLCLLVELRWLVVLVSCFSADTVFYGDL